MYRDGTNEVLVLALVLVLVLVISFSIDIPVCKIIILIRFLTLFYIPLLSIKLSNNLHSPVMQFFRHDEVTK